MGGTDGCPLRSGFSSGERPGFGIWDKADQELRPEQRNWGNLTESRQGLLQGRESDGAGS